ncbi:hypothetical protein R3P38DRAFT_2471264, partial [Favolaschia claudopus]
LAALNKPGTCCRAKHHRVNGANSRISRQASAEDVEAEIFLAEGAHIIITCDLWTSKGLVNGTQGF